ncbi:MAG TPA: phosphosulfolactate synthase [Firmicutes bacterium]|nr:phosphosulfolactate synthase [Bacillota bacterium]
MGAWEGIISSPIKGRTGKPRQRGLTMVLDKGLGFCETRDLLELAAGHLDIHKLTFGTPFFYPGDRLREKIALIRSHGVDVCPGGTLLEIAVMQGAAEPFLETTAALGFSCLEVSDGTIPMEYSLRAWCIRKARDMGFRVISEVGKKDPAQRMSPESMREMALRDLEAGAWKVIVEARESGKGVGIYDASGAVKMPELEQLVEGMDEDALIWEAPLKDQQVALIRRFGPNVNLGNVPPQDIIALEALRAGMRADTLRDLVLSNGLRSSIQRSSVP